MIELLKALEALQSVDAELGELNKGIEEYPGQLAQLDDEIGLARQAANERRQRVADLEGQKKALEEQVAADKEKVKKWEERLTEQRSPREYTALAREIDIAKKQNVTAAQEIVDLGKELQAAQEALKEVEASLEEEERTVRNHRARIRRALRVHKEKEDELAEKRNEAAKVVPTQMLRRYDQIQKRRGLAVVRVVSGTCEGCRMSIPPQLFNQLISRPRFDTCPSCARMIYVPDAFEREAAAQEA